MKNNPVIRVKPWIAFKVEYFPCGKNREKAGLHIWNIRDGSHLALNGRAASLWLMINGMRTVDQIITAVGLSEKIRERQYPVKAQNFLSEILVAHLVETAQPRDARDLRASDMMAFLRAIRLSKSRSTSRKKVTIKKEKGDRKAMAYVREKFSQLKSAGFKLRIARAQSLFSEIGLNVFSAKIVIPGHESVGLGYGAALGAEEAATSAVGEAVERACIDDSKIEVFSKTFEELSASGKKGLDPRTYRIYSEGQNAVIDGEVTNLSRKIRAHWQRFEEATTGDEILVPVDIERQEQHSRIPFFIELSGSGCASHTNPHKAKLNAVLELIERDHVLFYWRTQNTPSQIDIASTPDHIQNLWEKLGPMKKKIKLFYLKSDLGVSAVQSVFLGKGPKEPRFIHAAACRLDASDAIEKAILEIIYVLQGFKNRSLTSKVPCGRHFENFVWDFSDRSYVFDNFAMGSAYDFLFSASETVSFSEMPRGQSFDAKQGLDFLIKNLTENNIRLFFRDLTLDPLRNSGFSVFRAYSPDFIGLDQAHRYRQLGHSRYFTLPKKLNLRRKPSDASELSPWPHPIN